MANLEIVFWLLLALLFYTYFGYGILLLLISKFKKSLKSKNNNRKIFEPEVTLLVAAYNESDCLDEKVENTFNLNYPKKKLKVVFVTDGSTDNTGDILKKYTHIRVLHKTERQGKVSAVNRAMKTIKSPFVIFSDANSMLNIDAIRNLVKHFKDKKTGCVAGEKRIVNKNNASGFGEGLYWRYESFLKEKDSKINTAVGAAGELFAIRRSLFIELDRDTIIEDFVLSLLITQQGFKTAYEPYAYTYEAPSTSVKEEFKRKIRICAGGFQAILKLKNLLNPFKFGMLSFQYISHRVLRWTLAPISLALLIPVNLLLLSGDRSIYNFTILAQLIFYTASILGYFFEEKKIRLKMLFVPFYFCMMNFSAFAGFYRYIYGRQSVLWEKAQRMQ